MKTLIEFKIRSVTESNMPLHVVVDLLEENTFNYVNETSITGAMNRIEIEML